MLIVIVRGELIEEIAAAPATLARFGVVLDRARPQPAVNGRLLALPRVPDPSIPALTIHLRPHSTTGATH